MFTRGAGYEDVANPRAKMCCGTDLPSLLLLQYNSERLLAQSWMCFPTLTQSSHLSLIQNCTLALSFTLLDCFLCLGSLLLLWVSLASSPRSHSGGIWVEQRHIEMGVVRRAPSAFRRQSTHGKSASKREKAWRSW